MGWTNKRFGWVVLTLAVNWLVTSTPAQVFVGPHGSGVLTFDTAPPVQEWATASFGGDNGGTGIIDAAVLDAQVQSVSAVLVTNALASTQIVPPGQNNYTRWNSTAKYLQSRIGNVEFTVVMATLVNNTGTALQSLGVSYDLGGGLFSQEQVPGFRGYFSFTGEPGSWVVIPEFCTGTPGAVAVVFGFEDLVVWTPGAFLYLLWADDNGAGSDGYYTIDNVRVDIGPALSIRAAGPKAVDVSWSTSWWNHELQVSANLTEPGWQSAWGTFTTTNGTRHVVLDASPENRFFRTRGLIIIPRPGH